MRIIHLDSGRDWRGGQQQVLFLVQGLKDACVEQHLVVRLSGLVVPRMKSLQVPLSALPFKSEWDIRSLLKLAGIISRFRPDIVHAHDSRTLGVAAILRALRHFPHLVAARRVPFSIRGNPLWKWKYQRLPDKIITVSHFIQDSLIKEGVPAGKISVIYDGLEVPLAPAVGKREAARRMLGINGDEWTIGSVGHFTSEKGHEVLLQGFGQFLQVCQNARLVLVGDGPLRNRYLDLIQKMGLQEKVILAGTHPELGDVLPAFDLLAHPSLQEGLGSVILLAMAYQVPVCASRTGGIGEIVADRETGFLFQPGDPHHLASVLLETLRAPALRQLCTSNAHNRVLSRFQVKRMVAETLEVYTNVLEI